MVFDNWFHTIASDTSTLPDFNSDEWGRLFGDSTFQYPEPDAVYSDDSPLDLPSDQNMSTLVGYTLQDSAYLPTHALRERESNRPSASDPSRHHLLCPGSEG